LPYFSVKQMMKYAALSSPTAARALASLSRRRSAAMGAQAWDRDYGRGAYDRLGDLDELAHHAVIAGYVGRLNPDGDLLDIGCGSGVSERLLRRWYGTYHGVDFSAEGIAQARTGAPAEARFTVADACLFVPDAPADVIVMSEVVEYFDDLEAQMRRYAGHLKPGGHLIVSMWVSQRNLVLWPRIDGVLSVIDQTLVQNGRGQGWMIKVYRP
jgi:SAM-dependent methyltransferase